jgi:hypothetical protein
MGENKKSKAYECLDAFSKENVFDFLHGDHCGLLQSLFNFLIFHLESAPIDGAQLDRLLLFGFGDFDALVALLLRLENQIVILGTNIPEEKKRTEKRRVR